MKIRLLIISLVLGSLLGCGSTTSNGTTPNVTDSDSNAVQSILSAVTSEATASEGGGLSTLAVNSSSDNVSILTGSAGCSYTTARSTCTSSHDVATFNCNTDGYALTLSGSWSETYSGTGGATCTVPAESGETIARTTNGITTTINVTQVVGTSTTTDTNGGTTYAGSTITGGANTVVAADTTAGDDTTLTRTLTIPGEHKVGRYRGRTLYDHIITSSGVSTPLTITGTSRTTRVASGQVMLYHNVASYTATSSFNAVTWSDITCCYPTSGSITTTFTGSLTGTSTLLFSTACGSAVYSNTSGVASGVSLTACN